MRFLHQFMRNLGLVRTVRRRRAEAQSATESLEKRTLLTADLNGNTLRVTGTNAPDDILVTREGGRIRVSEDGQETFSVAASQVNQIRIFGLAGGDTINTRDVGIRTIVEGGNGADTIRVGNAFNTVQGGAGDDTIIGFRGRDQLAGGGGDDYIRGQGSGDILRGGNGNDTLLGADGFDSIFGGNGNDFIRGADGDDTLLGEAGNDTIEGVDGDDSIRGGSGGDLISGNSGNDIVRGGTGADTLMGGDGNDLLQGSGGRDVIGGGNGRDVLTGDEGRDSLMGGDDEDLLIAGTNSLSVNDMILVAAEWTSNNDYDQRVANIRDGSGRNNDRSNGDSFLIGRNRNRFTTVFNDVGAIDLINGDGGQDWFFISEDRGDDDLTDRNGTERRDVI